MNKKVIIFTLSFLIVNCQFYLSQSYKKDVKMGEKAAKQVEQQMGFYKHDSLEKVIRSIGNKLVSTLKTKPIEFNFEFHLVDEEEPNAFALPGGHVYVTRGILPIVQTEDELAGIIGHEMIHVLRRHSVKQFNREIFPAILKLPGNLINAITFSRLGNIINVPIGWISDPFIAKYSRKHEREADELGIQLAADAGYKPGSLAEVLARLSKSLTAMTGQAEKRNYLADHPYTPDRVEDVNRLSKVIIAKEPSLLYPSRERFLSQFNGLCYGSNPKNGYFKDSLFVQPELKFSMLMPSTWTCVNQPDVVAAAPNQKDKDAAIALSLSTDKKTAKELGQAMDKKIRRSSSTQIEFSGDTSINNLDAYLLRVNSVKSGKKIILEVLWITYNNNVYQIEGVSAPDKRKLIYESLRSFKVATQNQIDLIKINELKLVTPKPSEKLEDFSKRTKNQLKPNLMLILNDLQTENNLINQTSLKVVEANPYKY